MLLREHLVVVGELIGNVQLHVVVVIFYVGELIITDGLNRASFAQSVPNIRCSEPCTALSIGSYRSVTPTSTNHSHSLKDL